MAMNDGKPKYTPPKTQKATAASFRKAMGITYAPGDDEAEEDPKKKKKSKAQQLLDRFYSGTSSDSSEE